MLINDEFIYSAWHLCYTAERNFLYEDLDSSCGCSTGTLESVCSTGTQESELIADKCGTIWLLQNGLIDTSWIKSQNQLAPIRLCCYHAAKSFQIQQQCT